MVWPSKELTVSRKVRDKDKKQRSTVSVLSIQLREQTEKGREEVQGHHRKRADKCRMWDILQDNQDNAVLQEVHSME